jgi:hypothetical protein
MQILGRRKIRDKKWSVPEEEEKKLVRPSPKKNRADATTCPTKTKKKKMVRP